jgi:hypothetical protein
MKPIHASLLLALSVAACAGQPPPPPPPPRAAVVTPETTDGLYRGTSTRYQADSRACPYPGLVTLHVLSGQFTYRWNANNMVPSTIHPDGSVDGQLGEINLTGHVVLPLAGQTSGPGAAMRIEGDVTNGQCGIHYTVSRRGP